MKLLFGPAGIPHSASSAEDAIRTVKGLGLGAMELEFVRGVHTKPENALKLGKVQQEYGIELTAHGPYYINLNSLEPAKIENSVQHILKTARITKLSNGTSITFHAAYYMKMEPEKVFQQVKKQLQKILDVLKQEGNDIMVRPELTGKPTQFGDLKELIRLSQELENVLPCIDFSHMHARSSGHNNSYDEFHKALEELEKGLGKRIIQNMHCHVSGIEYGPKGEKNHCNLQDSDFKYKELMKALKDFGCTGIIISESPDLEEDALLMKKAYDSL